MIHHGAEWTVKPCPHQSPINTGDDSVGSEMIDKCVNSVDGLMILECHVTVGMATASEAVALLL